MDKKNAFIQDNIIFFLIPIIVFCAGAYYAYDGFTKYMDNRATLEDKRQTKITREAKYSQLKAAKERQEKQVEPEKTTKSGKVIYEVLGQQFSPEASFGIMFENVLSNITGNGVRIRSIDYNYSPHNDKVLQANAPGYNACELSFTTVASYSQLQNFFKSITKENYLTNIYEVYIEPYDRDKTILIAKFKVRLYTKTVHS
ncbi:MAG: hypothetical protein IKU37_09755 [Candidatus Gastranaerophilales bacterium]|nr:hypothetical protein [Candidatus Gastranaerophilales bacterium]